MEENEEVANYAMTEPEADEETIFQAMLDEGDEDASFVQDFEEQVIMTCQDSQELSSCFTAYQEARDRLREKARTRGYWPLKSGNKGKGRGKKGKGYGGGSYGSSMAINVKRRSLAERIANSTCRRCGQPGHWRRECPLNNSETPKDKTAFTGVSIDEATEDATAMQDVLTTLPEDAELFDQDGEDQAESKSVGQSFHTTSNLNFPGNINVDFESLQCSQVLSIKFPTFENSRNCSLEAECYVATVPNFSNQLAANLHRCCRKHFSPVRDEAAAVPDLDGSASTDAGLGAELDSKLRFSEASCLFNSEEADGEAIIDTGGKSGRDRGEPCSRHDSVITPPFGEVGLPGPDLWCYFQIWELSQVDQSVCTFASSKSKRLDPR